MKPGTIPIDGWRVTLETLLAAGLVLELYAANVTPGPGDTSASYPRLAVLGYAPIPLSSAIDAWQVDVDVRSGRVTATYREELVIRFGAYGPTVFGYLLTRGGHVLGVHPFDSPFRIENRGDSIALTPAIAMGGKAAR